MFTITTIVLLIGALTVLALGMRTAGKTLEQIAAAEVGVGLAIVLLVFRNRSTIAVDSLRELRERTDRDGTAPEDATDPP